MSLSICDAGHDEVVYDGGTYNNFKCPMCAMEESKDEEIAVLKEKADAYEYEINDQASTIGELEQRIVELE